MKQDTGQDKIESVATETFNIQLRKWLTPVMSAILLFVAKEYYTRMDKKLDLMISHIYRSDSIHMRLYFRLDNLEMRTGDLDEQIQLIKQDLFFIKPEEIKLKPRK